MNCAFPCKTLVVTLTLGLLIPGGFPSKVEAQNSRQNLALIHAAHTPSARTIDTLGTKTVLNPQRGFWLMRYNPVSLFFIGSMWTYQNLLSPQLSAECIYHQSCSNFSKRAIERYGFSKGVLLSSDRLIRCNPTSVQEAYEWEMNEATGKLNDPLENYR